MLPLLRFSSRIINLRYSNVQQNVHYSSSIRKLREQDSKMYKNCFEYYGYFDKSVIALDAGAPGPNLLKRAFQLVQTSMASLARRPAYEESLQYGCGPGNTWPLEQLAKFLSRQSGVDTRMENLFFTNGSTDGINFILRHFIQSGTTIFIENPTYSLLSANLKQFKVNVVPIPTDENGMDTKYLEKQVKRLSTKGNDGMFRAMIYTVPIFNNPTGICLSIERSRDLVRIAQDHQLLVVSDDVYDFLNYKICPVTQSFSLPPRKLISYDKTNGKTGNVISIGTFSKIWAPGLRLGWLEMPRDLIQNIVEESLRVQSGGCWATYLSEVAGHAMHEHALDRYLESTRQQFSSNMNVAHALICSKLGPLGVTCRNPGGGYFLWVQFPKEISTEKLLPECKQNGVTFLCGNWASYTGEFKNCLRICIAYYEEEELLRGLEIFCRISAEHMLKRANISTAC